MASTFFPEAVSAEVFQSQNPLTCAVMAPVNINARKVDGGVLITEGKWTFNSGIHHAGWDILGIPIVDADGAPQDVLIGILPTEQLTIIDDWNTIGLRGTGSCSVTATSLFVSDDRLASHASITAADYPKGRASHSPLYSLPVVPTVMIKMTLPSIGIAKGALGLFAELSQKRNIPMTFHRKQSEAAVTHIQLAEACAKIDAAETITRHSINELAASAQAKCPLGLAQRARMWRDAGFACKLAWEAVDILAGASGGSFARETNRMNRCWRDARVATSHAALCTTTTFEAYGRIFYGLPSNSPLLPG